MGTGLQLPCICRAFDWVNGPAPIGFFAQTALSETMTPRQDSGTTLLLAACAGACLLACSSSPGSVGTTTGASSNTGQGPNTSAVSTDDAGTTTTEGPGTAAANVLMCTPSSTQTSACSGMAAGSPCTLPRSKGNGHRDTDNDGGVRTIAGTCRSTFGGSGVACVPNPPAPPQVLTAPCGGKAAGDACTVQAPFGGAFNGNCVDRPGSATLICGRVRMPPQPLVDACDGKTAGDGCIFGGHHDGGIFTGVCGNGPTGQGPLACAPSQDSSPRPAAACKGLDAGTACSVGQAPWQVEGACTTPAGGGAALCLPPCPEPGYRFRRLRHGPFPPGPPGPMLDGGHR